jgi:hypothetical protein
MANATASVEGTSGTASAGTGAATITRCSAATWSPQGASCCCSTCSNSCASAVACTATNVATSSVSSARRASLGTRLVVSATELLAVEVITMWPAAPSFGPVRARSVGRQGIASTVAGATGPAAPIGQRQARPPVPPDRRALAVAADESVALAHAACLGAGRGGGAADDGERDQGEQGAAVVGQTEAYGVTHRCPRATVEQESTSLSLHATASRQIIHQGRS